MHIDNMSKDGWLSAEKFNEICKRLKLPVVGEEQLLTWVRNSVLNTKEHYRGGIVYLLGDAWGNPGQGHVGFLAHRNMIRGPIANLRDAVRAVAGVKKQKADVEFESTSKRLVPKAEIKSKVCQSKKPKVQTVFVLIRKYKGGLKCSESRAEEQQWALWSQSKRLGV
jgi:hypothetical protein